MPILGTVSSLSARGYGLFTGKGDPVFPTSFQTATVIDYNPATQATPNYGWYARSGGSTSDSTPGLGDFRQLVVKWGGVTVFNEIFSFLNPVSNYVFYTSLGYAYVVAGDYAYFPSTYRGSLYGWPSNGVDVGPVGPPSGDFGNAFDVGRSLY